MESAIRDNVNGALHHAKELEKNLSIAINQFHSMPDPNGLTKAFREILDLYQIENQSTLRYLNLINEFIGENENVRS